MSSALFTSSNNPLITSFYETFRGCSNLRGTSPALWISHSSANGGGCFADCNKLDNYSEIPDQWK